MTERFGRIDLHMHSTFSDGTDSPEELLRKARSEGLRLFSITDHDDVSSGKAVRALLKKDDPAFLPGVEFSCRDEYGKYHILGYGFDPDSSSVQSVVRRGHELRLARLQQRIDGLKTVFGITLPEEEIELLRKMDSPGKPHFGLLLVKYGFAETKKEAIEKYLNPLPVDSVYVRPGEAMEGILRGGGVPVLAHPFYGDGEDRLGPEEMEERLKHLIRCGLA
ncbi:MAG: PHP domain-containing protein, partial [Clostridia bacterium]|nr:PHP domain-containing protein [Clostridia bacterium]